MRVTQANEILVNMRKNACSTWCGDEFTSPGNTPSYAANRLQSRFLNIEAKGTFTLSKGQTVYTLGACDARAMESALLGAGLNVPSYDNEALRNGNFSSRFQWGPASFVNRFNTASMVLEVRRITGEVNLRDEELTLTFGDQVMDLHFAGTCDHGDMALTAKRREITRAVGASILDADVVLLTLGLAEAWFDTECGRYSNIAPELSALRLGNRFELHELDFDDNLRHLEAIRNIILSKNTRARFIVTVSPAPLMVTFTPNDVIVANTSTKSLLRAAAEAFCARHGDVDYFPGYEIVLNSHPAFAWQGDRRHIAPAMVEHVMRRFKIAYGLGKNDQDQLVRLTEFSDDRIYVEDSIPSGFSMGFDEIMLHPFDPCSKRRASVRFQGVVTRGLSLFTSGLRVGHPSAKPVVFEVAAFRRGTKELLRRACRATAAMETGTLELDLKGLPGNEIDITLATFMQDPSDSSDYAWAGFVESRLVFTADGRRT